MTSSRRNLEGGASPHPHVPSRPHSQCPPATRPCMNGRGLPPCLLACLPPDLKPANVLLTSSVRDSRQFTAKVCVVSCVCACMRVCALVYAHVVCVRASACVCACVSVFERPAAVWWACMPYAVWRQLFSMHVCDRSRYRGCTRGWCRLLAPEEAHLFSPKQLAQPITQPPQPPPPLLWRSWRTLVTRC